MIRNVWAVGRNYVEHAKELGNAIPQAVADPIIFLKAGSSVSKGETFLLPNFSQDVHYELELGFFFASDFSLEALTLAIDLTARDVQNRLKSQGQPWTLAKSFRGACLIGAKKPLKTLATKLEDISFSLKINGELRQSGNSRSMIHSVEKLRAYVLERFPVCPGDLMLTGTPAGVGQVQVGDHLEAEIPGFLEASWRAAAVDA